MRNLELISGTDGDDDREREREGFLTLLIVGIGSLMNGRRGE